jgi:hypothetical protein
MIYEISTGSNRREEIVERNPKEMPLEINPLRNHPHTQVSRSALSLQDELLRQHSILTCRK